MLFALVVLSCCCCPHVAFDQCPTSVAPTPPSIAPWTSNVAHQGCMYAVLPARHEVLNFTQRYCMQCTQLYNHGNLTKAKEPLQYARKAVHYWISLSFFCMIYIPSVSFAMTQWMWIVGVDQDLLMTYHCFFYFSFSRGYNGDWQFSSRRPLCSIH